MKKAPGSSRRPSNYEKGRRVEFCASARGGGRRRRSRSGGDRLRAAGYRLNVRRGGLAGSRRLASRGLARGGLTSGRLARSWLARAVVLRAAGLTGRALARGSLTGRGLARCWACEHGSCAQRPHGPWSYEQWSWRERVCGQRSSGPWSCEPWSSVRACAPRSSWRRRASRLPLRRRRFAVARFVVARFAVVRFAVPRFAVARFAVARLAVVRLLPRTAVDARLAAPRRLTSSRATAFSRPKSLLQSPTGNAFTASALPSRDRHQRPRRRRAVVPTRLTVRLTAFSTPPLLRLVLAISMGSLLFVILGVQTLLLSIAHSMLVVIAIVNDCAQRCCQDGNYTWCRSANPGCPDRPKPVA